MFLDGMAQAVGSMMASDGTLMLLSMAFGVLLGMLWSGRSFPRRLPRRFVRANALRRQWGFNNNAGQGRAG